MTEKQRRFIDEYIRNPNATKAAIAAGYTSKRANAIGYDLLTNPDVKAAIAERNDYLESERIAGLEECLELLTAIVRGEKKTVRVVGGVPLSLPPSLNDMLRACEIRLKTLGAFEARNEQAEALTKLDEVLEKLGGNI